MNLGPVSLPMTRAYVHTVLPSLLDSFRIASPGPVIGTLNQDRSTAIAGTIGPGPATIPVPDRPREPARPSEDVRVRGEPRPDPHADSRLLFHAGRSADLRARTRWSDVRCARQRARQDPGELLPSMTFSRETPPAARQPATSSRHWPCCRARDLAHLDIDGVDLTITSTESAKTLFRWSALWLDAARVKAGPDRDGPRGHPAVARRGDHPNRSHRGSVQRERRPHACRGRRQPHLGLRHAGPQAGARPRHGAAVDAGLRFAPPQQRALRAPRQPGSRSANQRGSRCPPCRPPCSPSSKPIAPAPDPRPSEPPPLAHGMSRSTASLSATAS